MFRLQALVREQQKAQEVNRLQEVINKILREAGKRTREEVERERVEENSFWLCLLLHVVLKYRSAQGTIL